MTEAPAVPDTLLIVDDEANILTALGRLFRRDGYRLLSAPGGRDALELLANNTDVGVILSDQRMPDMNGIEFLRAARALRPDTVRIMLSGYTELSSVTDSVNEVGIYKFLTKPWDDDALREAVRKAFHLFGVTRENTRLTAAVREANASLTQLNHELEARVAEKTREALRNQHILRASQEILAQLPLPVLGIDADGYLVLVNHAAERELGVTGGSLGERATEVLPEALARIGKEGPGAGVLDDGRAVHYWRYPLGAGSAAMGDALVIHQIGTRTLP